MSILVAIVVLLSLVAGGIVGALWRLSAVLVRQADRVGVGTLRGGMLLQRFRIPMLLWAGVLLVVGLVLGIVWADRGVVLGGLIVGAAVAAAALVALPRFAPQWFKRLGTVVGRRVVSGTKRRLRRR